jgi:peptidoglycan/xylan/chitin deacetylase (PgdA/CDA1 family)
MLIVLYHGVRPTDDHTSPDIRQKHVPEHVFRTQAQYLAADFTPMGLSDVVECLRTGKQFPKRGLCVTFDDGYANNAETAAPILKQLGIPATFFVTTGFIDGTTRLWVDRFETAFSALPRGSESDSDARNRLKHLSPDEREAALRDLEARAGTAGLIHSLHRAMTWDQVRGLATDGFEIGAHTLTHPVLPTCPAEEATWEIVKSKQTIERNGIPCRHFALPNGQPGDWNDDILRIVREAGFVSCLTTVDGFIDHGDDPFTLKRTTIDTGEDLLKFRLTVSGWRATIHKLRNAIRL